MTETNEDRKKAKSKGFATLGVPVGSTLTYRKDPAITCTVVDDRNKVEYKGKVYPISGLAKEFMKTPISGYHAFKYNGVLLAKLGEGKTDVKEDVDVKPAQTAQVAPQVASGPKPQIMPLPSQQGASTKPSTASPEDIACREAMDPLRNQGDDSTDDEPTEAA